LVSKEDVACYRLYAANCVELAERTSDPERRVFLLRMGQRWGRLAEQVEKAERANSELSYSDPVSVYRPAVNQAVEEQASQAQASQAQASQAQASQTNLSQANADDIPGDQIRVDQTGVDQSGCNQNGDQNNGGAGVSSR
jgi:NACalpha-BTF3-like transcription factor